MIHPSQNTLSKLREDVSEYMKTEITVMREVLANMYQEELALIMLDKSSLHQTLQERFPLIQRLSFLRTERMAVTEAIKHISLSPLQQEHTNGIFPVMEDLGCEIDYLSEQMLALIKSMNFQNTKNDTLTKQYELYTNYPSRISHLMPWHAPENKTVKQKVCIATYPMENP